MATITAILNVSKNLECLDEQYKSLMNQTIKPTNVIILNNGSTQDFSKYKCNDYVLLIDSNLDFGSMAKFYISLLANTEYVCVFDNQTIPGSKWFENCINTMKIIKRGIVGSTGIIFEQNDSSYIIKSIGTTNCNENIVHVDTLYHSWFFKRSDLEEYTENMQLSHLLQINKYLNAYIPPHPKNDPDMWGSSPKTHNIKDLEYLLQYERQNSDFSQKTIYYKNIYLKNYTLANDYFVQKIIQKEPFSLLRYSERDYNIIHHNAVSYDGWCFKGGFNPVLPDALLKTLELNFANVYYGIPMKCDNEVSYNFFIKNIPLNSNITFTNVFANYNYARFMKFLLTSSLDIVLMAPNNINNQAKNINVIEYYKVDSNLVHRCNFDIDKYLIEAQDLAQKYQKTIFFISAGPIAKLFIYFMYLKNPNNSYIDVGSSIDVLTKGIATRRYHNEVSENCHKCSYDEHVKIQV